ncbi:hypothetical protein [Neoehrlichia mikurensis]
MGSAKRIPGITPAAITMIYLRHYNKQNNTF